MYSSGLENLRWGRQHLAAHGAQAQHPLLFPPALPAQPQAQCLSVAPAPGTHHTVSMLQEGKGLYRHPPVGSPDRTGEFQISGAHSFTWVYRHMGLLMLGVSTGNVLSI